jgi:hypothetical protein
MPAIDATGTRDHHAGYPNQAQRFEHIKTREETGVNRALYIRRNCHRRLSPKCQARLYLANVCLTSALNRSIDCAHAFIALAMIMLPTGTRIASPGFA